MVKAISLFTGSLPSLAATKLIMEEEGVEEVKLLYFRSPFFRDYDRIKEMARGLWGKEVSFRSQSVKKEFRELSNIQEDGTFKLKNSCIGCRRLILRNAYRYMKKVGADFIVTGALVGKRNLSESDLIGIPQQLGLEDLVVRPLSGQLLPPTFPERVGWIKRENMKDFTDQDMDKVAKLIKEWGISVNGFPAEERCKLTQEDFGRRLEDLFKEGHFTMNALELLEFDLYYKKPPDVKIVLGKDDEEKRRLQKFFLPEDLRLYIPTHDGPIALVRTDWRKKSNPEIQNIIELTAKISVAHSSLKEKGTGNVQANYRFEKQSETFRINVAPFSSEDELNQYLVKGNGN